MIGKSADRAVQKAMADPDTSVSKMEFDMNLQSEGGVGPVYKSGDDDDDTYVIWGKASVEVVDRENDRIKAKALEKALPQLLKRSTLSYEHTDQVVGEILKSFETEEPVDVEVGGETFKRQEFPTDVLDLPGQEPSLYVAGNVFSDTKKSREVREAIEKEEIRSYSISGEAIVSEMAVEDGRPVTDILKMDLSAVTLCRQGMNQKAKFGLVSKQSDPSDPTTASAVAKSAIDERFTMTDTDDDNETELEEFRKSVGDLLDDRLPEGELATVEDVEKTVDERVEELEKDDYDADEEDLSEESEEIPEGPEGDEAVGVDNPANKSVTLGDLKSTLSSDQWDAIGPVVKEQVLEGEEEDLEVVEPELEDEDRDPDMAHKSADDLSDDEVKALYKSRLEKSDPQSAAIGAALSTDAGTPSHAAENANDGLEDLEKSAENENIAKDPAMASVYDEEGNPVI